MASRKRTRRDVDAEDRELEAAIAASKAEADAVNGKNEGPMDVSVQKEPSKLEQLRNMWEFASLMQYLHIFGAAIRLDSGISVEDMEAECLKPESSEKLMEIGLAMLKFVSSHRGLTPDLFDEYARRQYLTKGRALANPFGEEEDAKKFREFNTFTKIRVLRQLAVWSLNNAERVRERMYETEREQAEWRLEPIGEDAKFRVYYLAFDDRLYRLSGPEPTVEEQWPGWKPKANTKKARAAAKAARRAARRAESKKVVEEEDEAEEEAKPEKPTDNGLDGHVWECVAVTLEDFRVVLDTYRRSRNANEKELYANLAETVLPIIEKADAKRQQEEQRKQKELLTLEMLSNAKRSSRIAGKLEREKQEQDEREAAAKRRQEELAARRERQQQEQLEHARETRIQSREQRNLEREQRRLQNQLALENLSKDSEMLDQDDSTVGRKSARTLQNEIERVKNALEEDEEEDWFFDCSGCGVHGENYDDGTHVVACEKCNVWQHSACLGIPKEEAESDDFHFVCKRCKQIEADAKRAAESPKLTLKIKLGKENQPRKHDGKVTMPKKPVHDNGRKASALGQPLPPAVNGSSSHASTTISRSQPLPQQVLHYPSPSVPLKWPTSTPPASMAARATPAQRQTPSQQSPYIPPYQPSNGIPPAGNGYAQRPSSGMQGSQLRSPVSHSLPTPSRPAVQTSPVSTSSTSLPPVSTILPPLQEQYRPAVTAQGGYPPISRAVLPPLNGLDTASQLGSTHDQRSPHAMQAPSPSQSMNGSTSRLDLPPGTARNGGDKANELSSSNGLSVPSSELAKTTTNLPSAKQDLLHQLATAAAARPAGKIDLPASQGPGRGMANILNSQPVTPALTPKVKAWPGVDYDAQRASLDQNNAPTVSDTSAASNGAKAGQNGMSVPVLPPVNGSIEAASSAVLPPITKVTAPSPANGALSPNPAIPGERGADVTSTSTAPSYPPLSAAADADKMDTT